MTPPCGGYAGASRHWLTGGHVYCHWQRMQLDSNIHACVLYHAATWRFDAGTCTVLHGTCIYAVWSWRTCVGCVASQSVETRASASCTTHKKARDAPLRLTVSTAVAALKHHPKPTCQPTPYGCLKYQTLTAVHYSCDIECHFLFHTHSLRHPGTLVM